MPTTPSPLNSHGIRKPLTGTITVPGDKSISHRSLIIASQAIGTSNITGLLEGEDVLATANALKSLGVRITQQDNKWLVNGVGIGGLSESATNLDLGNSGTGVRLLMGLVSPYPFPTTFTGDKSLRSRPMSRIIIPLQEMLVEFSNRTGGRLPLTVIGNQHTIPITYKLPVASAQVKSAILLAGLNTLGKTTVIEPTPTRDHTELMLQGFGANITTDTNNNNERTITLTGQPYLKSMDLNIPGDPSSASFIIVAALITPNSHVTINNICINPLRTGLFTSLIEMGAKIEFTNTRTHAGEEIADIIVQHSNLQGITIPAERAASMIDEYPILSIAAANATGTTLMQGLSELRVKESDRLEAISNGLTACGIPNKSGDDWLEVTGHQLTGGQTINTCMDHRIAMSFLIAGLTSTNPITIDDSSMIKTSFPQFTTLLNNLGANLH